MVVTIMIVKMICGIISIKYFIAAILLCASLAAITFYSTKFAILLLLFIGFFGHQIIQFGAPPALIYVFDLILIILFVKTVILKCLSDGKFQLYGSILVALLLMVIIVSHVINV